LTKFLLKLLNLAGSKFYLQLTIKLSLQTKNAQKVEINPNSEHKKREDNLIL